MMINLVKGFAKVKQYGSHSSPISVSRFQPGVQHADKRTRSRRFKYEPKLLRINPLQHSRFDVGVNHISFRHL